MVELISGIPWATYVEENILKPLHTDHTTLRQPVPSYLQNQLATGYEYSVASARFGPQPFEYVPAAPAGAFSATATDMARFMITHLQLGRLDGSQISGAETARKMHSTSFCQDGLLPSESAGWEAALADSTKLGSMSPG
ncbi:MAG: serine hydrolase [Firmicutes bacterium]|nr:serine hydrolase [Bacillota bacterium]